MRFQGSGLPSPSESVAAILMASGFSKRFGERNKLLVPFKGKPLARYTLELVTGIGFSGGIFFVTADDDVAALAADLKTVNVIKNLSPEKGRRESVRLGLEAANADYYLFFPCDQPFLDAATVQRILDARSPVYIVEPRSMGMPGNPCLFSAAFRGELLSLKDGETPRLVKEQHKGALRGVEVSNPLALEDVDDEEDFNRLSSLNQ